MKKTIFFSKNLQYLMLQTGEEPQKVAELLRISPQAVGRWINENKLPAHDRLATLAEHYNVSVDELAYKDLMGSRKYEVNPNQDAAVSEGTEDYYTRDLVKTHLLSIRKHLHDINEANDRMIGLMK